MLLIGIVTFVAAMFVTWAVTPAVIRLAHSMGALDQPGGRKVHGRPIPRIGGIGVFLGFTVGLAVAAFFTGKASLALAGSVYQALLAAATLMLIVGFIDDMRGLHFVWKLLAQTAAASFVWFAGFQIDAVTHPLGGTLELGVLSLPLTVLWIVGITNAVNLIDGLDGLATGIALITTTAVALIALIRSELGTAAASVALAGSLIGFLGYNFSPARIFLGDCGSMFLGFILAVTAVRGSQKGTTAVALLVPLLVLGLPVVDTGLAVLRRLYRLGLRGGATPNRMRYVVANFDEIFHADRGHIHHRLLDLGLSHRWAVVVLYSVGVIFAASAFCLVLLKSMWLALLLLGVQTLLMAAFFTMLYLRVWRRTASAEAPPPRNELPAPAPAEQVLAASTRTQGR